MDIETLYNLILCCVPVGFAMMFTMPISERRPAQKTRGKKAKAKAKRIKARPKKKPKKQKKESGPGRYVAPQMSAQQERIYNEYRWKRDNITQREPGGSFAL